MTCAIKGCNNDECIIYYDYNVCEHHWDLHTSIKHSFDLKTRFKIKDKKGQSTLSGDLI